MGPKFIDTLFWALKPILKSNTLSDEDILLIKQFILHLATSEHGISMSKIKENLNQLWSKDEDFSKLKGVSGSNNDIAKTIILTTRDLDLDDTNSPANIPTELLMIGTF